MLYVNQDCHGICCCVKDGNCPSSTLSESRWTVLMGCLTISTNVDAVKHITDDHFSFNKTVHWCIVCVQHSPTAAVLSTNTAFEWKMWFSCFPIFPGSAEAQVIWGGILKYRFIAYFIGNISAKNIKICYVCQSYSKPQVGRFLRHGVHTLSQKSFHL